MFKIYNKNIINDAAVKAAHPKQTTQSKPQQLAIAEVSTDVNNTEDDNTMLTLICPISFPKKKKTFKTLCHKQKGQIQPHKTQRKRTSTNWFNMPHRHKHDYTI